MDYIKAKWGPFDLDPCCEIRTQKAPSFFTKEDDGLNKPWFGRVFMNPPYGEKNLRVWMRKAYEESLRGATVFCLVPAQTGAVWFHDWALRGKIHFLKGKVYFLLDGEKIGAPILHSLIVEFRVRVGSRG
jgi:site-specific DNA-methyltransferase (adenine-specific)